MTNEKRPAGRPRLPDEDRRAITVQVHLSQREWEWLKQESDRTGQPMAFMFRSVIPRSVRKGRR